MINFEYLCEQCGSFEMLRPSGLSKHPAPCPKCQKLSSRAYTISNIQRMDPVKKAAIERNIKAQHEPELCGSGCSHEKYAQTPSQLKGQPRYKTYTGPRPWVIEHAK